MPKPCSVCKHPERSAIDRELARNVVRYAALVERYGLSKSALFRHKTEHLPDFLQALTGHADAPADPVLHAELQRLYLTTLDALADAQAGTLAIVGHKDGEPIVDRIWSPTAVARLIGEARKGLGAISALVADARTVDAPASKSPELDAAFTRALNRFADRQSALGPATEIVDDALVLDAEVVDTPITTHSVDIASRIVTTTANEPVDAESMQGEPTPYAGVGANGAAGPLAPSQGDPNLDALPEMMGPLDDPTGEKRAAELYLAGLPVEVRKHIAEVIDQAASNDQLNPETLRKPWPGNPAATIEERRAEGWADPQPLEPTPQPPQPPQVVFPASDRTSRRPTHRPVDQSHDPNLPTRRKA